MTGATGRVEPMRDDADRQSLGTEAGASGLRQQVARLESDLQQARRELAQARLEQERLAEQLSALQSGSPPSAPAPHGKRPRSRPRSWRARWSRSERNRQDDLDLLYQSGLFDADWYRSEYPDVANTGMDPAEHFLLHGGFEGRNPGPEFDTQQYLFDHPDLAGGSVNPLLHFIRSGGTIAP